MRWRIRGTPSESGARRIVREREQRVVMPLPVVSGTVLVSANNTIGTFNTNIKTTTGYAQATFWDASQQVFGTGNPSVTFTVTKSLVGSPAGKKPTSIVSSNAIGGKGGNILTLQTFANTTELDLRAIESPVDLLHVISMNTNVLFPEDPFTVTSLVLTDCEWKRLDAIRYDYLTASNTTAREIDCGCQPAVNGISLTANALATTINVNGVVFIANSSLQINGNAALTTVLLKNSNVRYVEITANPLLTSLDLGELANAYRINLSGNNLTSVSLKDTRPTGGKSTSSSVTPALDLRLNQLSATALNDVFADLGNVGGSPVGLPIIHVAQNPGAATCTPSIATAKGYVVLTT